METNKRKSIEKSKAPARTKLVFTAKLVLSLLIGYSFSRFESFYAEYPAINNIAYGLNTFLTASILISVGRFLMISWYNRRSRGNDRVRGSVDLGINQFAGILNAGFGILGIMLALGINPKDFLTSITLVAMAIALLFKDYITNMISGLLIMFSDRFTIGDYIKIGEYEGKIVDITLSNIVIRNDDQDMVLIPNNAAFTLNIVNQTLENTRKMVIDFDLPLARSYRHDKLEALLLSELQKMNGEVVMDTVQFRLMTVNHQAVQFKLSFTLHSKAKTKKSKIRKSLLGIVLAFDVDQQDMAKSSEV